ncbi:MAG TPA: glycosyl-4,4'-diaponeurosporenoate acyltransferase [Anaerolineaceae bacterium]|jgi:glycosyl-4,4'-diaponeurosporenoate acyltransferase|nr:glycosyl-4,4'-diaponeurosporenoate acyltransferase [Anaerolineaceae bacterium]
MRVLFLPTGWTLILCFVVWVAINLTVSFICVSLPDEWMDLNSFLFPTRKFEKDGQIYQDIFRIRHWKHLLPDGGSLWKKKGYKKKHLKNYSEENLIRFLVESCRGELTHWLAIFSFWVFGFFLPLNSLWFMLLYALVANLPCIFAQRYNRPRVQKLLRKVQDAQVKNATVHKESVI